MVLDMTDSGRGQRNPAEDRSQPDFNGPPGRQFQVLLVSLGVAQQPRGGSSPKSSGESGGLTVAMLAELSGIGRETWRRCANEGDLPRLEAVPAMCGALRQCGRPITDEQGQQAVLADLAARHTKLPTFRVSALEPGASPADQVVSVIRGLTDDTARDKLIRDVAALFTPEERMDFIRGMANPAPSAGAIQEESSQDDRGRGDGDGSTSG